MDNLCIVTVVIQKINILTCFSCVIKIAIAEGHIILRKSIAMFFERDNRFNLDIEAGNGKELIRKLTEKTVALVILDISTPILNGIKHYKLLKKNILK